MSQQEPLERLDKIYDMVAVICFNACEDAEVTTEVLTLIKDAQEAVKTGQSVYNQAGTKNPAPGTFWGSLKNEKEL